MSARRIVFIYASVHHKNTEKVVKYLASALNADAIDIIKNPKADISPYDIVIPASGIYFNQMHKNLREYLENTSLKGKKIIVFYTCGIRYKNYAKAVKKLLNNKEINYLGDTYCRGYDTFGPLKKIGGIAKKHPSTQDMQRVTAKIKRLLDENA